MKSVEGKTVLITGAAIGMGKLHAKRAAAAGAATLVLWDIDEIQLAATAAEVSAMGAKVHRQVVDVSNTIAIRQAAERVRREVGHVDVLINNAGIVRGKPFVDHEPDDIWRTIAVNTLAPMYIAREFLPAMIEAKTDCHIVNIASASGLLAVPKMSVYVASKWAAIGWSDSLRLELTRAGHTHVHVTTVVPSYVSTGMFTGAKAMRLAPILTPEKVVDAIWNGIYKQHAFVFRPRTVRLAMAARGLLPSRLWDAVADRVLGIYGSAQGLVGRATEAPAVATGTVQPRAVS